MSSLLERDRRPAFTVIAADCGIDACFVVNGDRELGDVLVLSPNQTFDYAVTAVQRVLPALTVDQAGRIVRENLPALHIDLDQVLDGYSTRWITEAERREARRIRMMVGVCGGIVFALLLVCLLVAVLCMRTT